MQSMVVRSLFLAIVVLTLFCRNSEGEVGARQSTGARVEIAAAMQCYRESGVRCGRRGDGDFTRTRGAHISSTCRFPDGRPANSMENS